MKRIVIVLATLVMVGPAFANDWPQFRGPNGSGVSDETGLPEKWSKTKNVVWKAEIPARGLSSPVIAGGRVYITANSGVQRDRLHVLCYDAADGKLLWHRQMTATGNTGCHPMTNMAAPSPVATADGVHALFACGDLASFDKDGNLRWYRSLIGDYPTIANQVGMASSPVLWKDFLIVPMDSVGESFIAALDVRYGTNVWKVKRPRDINFVTPALRPNGDKPELIFPSRTEYSAYDPSSGKKLWTHPIESPTIASPVVAGDFVLAPSSGLFCLKTDGNKVKEVWKSQKLGSGSITPLVYQNRVYNIGSAGVVVCADAKNGNPLWSERVAAGRYWASPIAGDGKVYVFNEKGQGTVLKAGKAGEVLAENDLEEEVLATPAIADASLFIRTDKHLYRIGIKK